MKSIGKVFIRLLTVALAVVFVVSGYHVWEILHDRRTAETAYEDLDAFVRSEGKPGQGPGRRKPRTGQYLWRIRPAPFRRWISMACAASMSR